VRAHGISPGCHLLVLHLLAQGEVVLVAMPGCPMLVLHLLAEGWGRLMLPAVGQAQQS
jgi:hypothetical protein